MAERDTVLFDITPDKEASKLQFLRRQFSAGPPALLRSDVNLSGKTAIVTGGNGGIGMECSRQLLDLGLKRLIITVRDEAKGEAARDALLARKPLEPDQTIDIWQLNLASYESVTAFAQKASTLSPRLDIAILNAGVNRGSFSLNPTTGHEEDIQTNYLSTMLLVLLLLDIFQKSAATPGPGRIVVVSSDTSAWAKFAEKDQEPLLPSFNTESSFDKFDRYATTKLLGQLFITELAKRVPPTLAIINCANPGLCYGSGLARELGTASAIFIRLIGRPAAIGARTLVSAAVEQDEMSHGQYIEDGKLRPMAPLVYDRGQKHISERLWSETMNELSFAGAQSIVENLARE